MENLIEFKFRNVTLVETAKFVAALSDSTSFGHDQIDSIAIKSASSQLICPLQFLINSSLGKSKFARKWKFSKLTPTLKSKDCNRMLPSSYRPVAVLSTVSKIVEHVAQSQLLEHFEKSGLLNPSNHAYRRHLTQYVEIGTAQSRMTPVLSGIQQGSVIGPVLYAIYTNKLTDIVKQPTCQEVIHRDTSNLFGRQCKQCGILSIYADDLTYVIGNRQRHLNQSRLTHCLDKISLFLQDNSLILNLPKTSLTEVMIPQKRTRTQGLPPNLVVNDGTEVKQVKDKSYTRILGANIQSNMSWQAHMETGKKAMLPGVRKQLGLLKHISKLVPKSVRLTLATGLIVSRLSYLMPLWGGGAECYISRAQVLLNSAARWVTGMNKRSRIRDLMDATGWLTIREQICAATALQTWKLVHYGTPNRLQERMQVQEDLSIIVSSPRLVFSRDCYRWSDKRVECLASIDEGNCLYIEFQKTAEETH